MRSTFEAISNEIVELKKLIDSIDPVNSVLANQADESIKNFVSIRRRFDYASFIIALYASLESYIEELASAYAHTLASHSDYASLPEQLQKKHMFRTAEILARGRPGEGRYTGLAATTLVSNLHTCLSGEKPYSLNTAAVAAHDVNLRSSEVERMFNDVGIEALGDRIRRTPEVIGWYCEANDLPSPPDTGIPSDVIDRRISQIVERRNRVAHTGGSPDDLLGISDMRELARFVLAYAKGVFAVVADSYLVKKYVEDPMAVTLRLTEKPLQQRRVLIVRTGGNALSINQPVFTVAGRSPARFGRIQTLFHDDKPITSVEAGQDLEVGVGIDFKSHKKPAFYVLKREDNLVWPSF